MEIEKKQYLSIKNFGISPIVKVLHQRFGRRDHAVGTAKEHGENDVDVRLAAADFGCEFNVGFLH
jgi:hypothetical protein